MNTLLSLLACGFDPGTPDPAPITVASRAFEGERPPDVILVSIDTLRPDHLGAYGHDRDTSPFMDGLAERGVRFAHARSASPWTLPAHTTMFSGLLPSTHLVIEDDLRLPDTVPVLAEALQERGLHTGAAVSTLFVSSMYGFDRGFEHFNDFGIHDKKTNLQGVVEMKGLSGEIERYVRAIPDGEPMFLFLHTYDAHYAYDPPPPYDTMFDRSPTATDERYKTYHAYKRNPISQEQLDHQVAQYDESIRYIDDQLARLDGVFRELGREVRWVVTADHGEEFGERGSWGHAHTLYDEQLRIPLIMSGPGIPAGVVVEEPVGNHDIAPTIAAWAGVDLGKTDGIDLGPFLSGEVPPPARPFVAETSRRSTMRLSLFENGKRLEWNLANGKAEVFAADADLTPLSDKPDAMRERLLEVLGQPWKANTPGTAHGKKLRFLAGGRAQPSLALKNGDTFHVFPFDGNVRFAPPGSKPGRPMAAAGGREPSGPLAVEDLMRPTPVDLSAATKAALETIGYTHDE